MQYFFIFTFRANLGVIMNERRSKIRIREENRLQEILLIAEEQIEKNGIKGINMSDIIARSGISRATIYSAFENKETLIALLAIKGINQLFTLTQKAKDYGKFARIKLLTFLTGHSIFIQRYSLLFQCIYESNTLSSREKMNKNTEALFDLKVHEIIEEIQFYIELAIANKEIDVQENISSFDMALFLYTVTYGMINISKSVHLDYTEATNKYKYLLRSILDSWSFHPLSTEYDYDTEAKKIIRTCFIKEYKELMHIQTTTLAHISTQ